MLRNTHHAIGETTDEDAQAPGLGSELTTAYCGSLEAQRALDPDGLAGIWSRFGWSRFGGTQSYA